MKRFFSVLAIRTLTVPKWYDLIVHGSTVHGLTSPMLFRSRHLRYTGLSVSSLCVHPIVGLLHSNGCLWFGSWRLTTGQSIYRVTLCEMLQKQEHCGGTEATTLSADNGQRQRGAGAYGQKCSSSSWCSVNRHTEYGNCDGFRSATLGLEERSYTNNNTSVRILVHTMCSYTIRVHWVRSFSMHTHALVSQTHWLPTNATGSLYILLAGCSELRWPTACCTMLFIQI